MVQSRFSGGHSIKLPAVCHKELYDLPFPYEDGLPTSMTAMALWRESSSVINAAESWRLLTDSALPGWSGSNATEGDIFRCEVTKTITTDLYDVKLLYKRAGESWSFVTWPAVMIFNGPPWISPILDIDWGWPWDGVLLQLLD